MKELVNLAIHTGYSKTKKLIVFAPQVGLSASLS